MTVAELRRVLLQCRPDAEVLIRLDDEFFDAPRGNVAEIIGSEYSFGCTDSLALMLECGQPAEEGNESAMTAKQIEFLKAKANDQARLLRLKDAEIAGLKERLEVSTGAFETVKKLLASTAANYMRACERMRGIAELSTGWKHGNEGVHLLRINDLALAATPPAKEEK